MDTGCTVEWLAGLLDMDRDEAEEHDVQSLARSAGEVDFSPIYATDLACMGCENGDDHADDGSECENERCEECGDEL
jgi:hypothetical protein